MSTKKDLSIKDGIRFRFESLKRVMPDRQLLLCMAAEAYVIGADGARVVNLVTGYSEAEIANGIVELGMNREEKTLVASRKAARIAKPRIT